MQEKMSLMNEYSSFDPENVEKIKSLAVKLFAKNKRPLKILHINSTKFGGGVAEILRSLVRLSKSTGLDVSWEIIEGTDEFFKTTKRIHNGLQGMDVPLTLNMMKTYLKHNLAFSQRLDIDEDVVIVHDPQPMGVIDLVKKSNAKWVWRCHIDLTSPNADYLDFVKDYVPEYDAAVFSLNSYVNGALQPKNTFIIAPCIDPLSDKNKDLSDDLIEKVAYEYNIDMKRPIISQISRFDPWKDPLGVIDVYRTVKKSFPDLQLVIIGSLATDDPEGNDWCKKVIESAGDDRDIHVLSNLDGVGDIEVNAIQRMSNVVLQMSIREGFGLSVAEALWKGRPVVARGVGGITVQVIDNETGYLIKTVEEAAQKIEHLLKNPEEAERISERAKEHVRQNFLITRLLREELEMIEKLMG